MFFYESLLEKMIYFRIRSNSLLCAYSTFHYCMVWDTDNIANPTYINIQKLIGLWTETLNHNITNMEYVCCILLFILNKICTGHISTISTCSCSYVSSHLPLLYRMRRIQHGNNSMYLQMFSFFNISPHIIYNYIFHDKIQNTNILLQSRVYCNKSPPIKLYIL